MNCDPIARWYRWLEYLAFGRALERRRIAFLTNLTDARRILVLGDGDGRFLAHLVQQNTAAQIDYVDLSPRMLELARARAGDRVTYHQADALTIELPAATSDLICTHFFLDCFDEPDMARLVGRIANAAGPDARWLVSEFCASSAWSRMCVRVLYSFFRLTTGLRTAALADYRPSLEQHGFSLAKVQTARLGLLKSELWTRSSLRSSDASSGTRES